MKPFELIHGSNTDILPSLAENRFHSIVTDPPYGIRFMGKAWDKFDIDKMANEAFSKGRRKNENHRSMAAGKYDKSRNANYNFQLFTENWARSAYRTLRPGGHLVCFASPRTFHRMVCGIEDAGFEIRETIMWVFASGFPKSHNLKDEFKGYGTALKPGFEPICIARKPIEKGLRTIDRNMQKWGTGAINIDGCRIDGEPWKFGTQTDIKGGNYNTNKPSEGNIFKTNVEGGEQGRWPANLIHDGSNQVRSGFPDSTGQNADLVNAPSERAIFGNSLGLARNFKKRNDSDKSAARFFYCAKTSDLDRNEGCLSMPDKNGGFRSENSGQHITRREKEYVPGVVKNNHPTVKPTSLMRYLIRLVTPAGGECLDPFNGSGSTGKAAMYEHRKYVGIELEKEYIDISACRIDFAIKNRDNQIKIAL